MAMSRTQAFEIIDRLYSGFSFRRAMGDDETARRSFYEMIASDNDLAQRYARAQEARAEFHAEEIITIADEEPDPRRAKVQIDARRWYAAKMKPRKYGATLELAVREQPDARAVLADMRARAGLLEETKQRRDTEEDDLA